MSRHVTGGNAMVGAAGAGHGQTGPTPASPSTLGTDPDDVVNAAGGEEPAPRLIRSRPRVGDDDCPILALPYGDRSSLAIRRAA